MLGGFIMNKKTVRYHRVDMTPKWENLMPLYFEILSQKPVSEAQDERLDFIKGECLRAAKSMDGLVEKGKKATQRDKSKKMIVDYSPDIALRTKLFLGWWDRKHVEDE
jgi:hypothetical protein